MSRDAWGLALIAGAGLLLVKRSGGVGGALDFSKMFPDSRAEEVYALADEIRMRYYAAVDPLMLTAMAKIESGYKPSAIRQEPTIGDASIGLMQTLYGTARWLHDAMGYNAYQLPGPDALFDPATSMYFGGAMVNWLRTYGGTARGEQWIVESYNGGPGNSNSQTRNHWAKYQAAKAELLRNGVGSFQGY